MSGLPRSFFDLTRAAAGRTTGGPEAALFSLPSFASDRTSGDAGFRRSR